MVKTDPLFDRLSQISQAETALVKRQRLTRSTPLMPLDIVSATLSVDHVLISPERTVAVLSPDDAVAASHYARLRPWWQVEAWVPDIRTMVHAQNRQVESNLVVDKWVAGQKRHMPPEVIMAVGWAHRTYSAQHYNLNKLAASVQEVIAQLPVDGQLLIQDIALGEDPDRFVLLEIDHPEAIAALIEFSKQARPELPQGLRGFFLESLTPSSSVTQRFRLTAKWATEFFHRWRLGVQSEAPYELTTLSTEQWASLIEQSGARAVYRAPHYLKRSDIKAIEQEIRFYDEMGKKLELPPATFSLVVQKIQQTEPVAIYERRPAENPAQELRLSHRSVEETGQLTTWIELETSYDDILFWRIDPENNLRIWVQADVPRPVINTVPRGTANLDGRRWAGYMIEPLTLHATDHDQTKDTISEGFSLPDRHILSVQLGVSYYPAPEYLAQRVKGLFVQVSSGATPEDIKTSSQQGRIIEVLADDVLSAIRCGLIPDSNLGILVGCLMQQMGHRPRHLGQALYDPDLKPTLTKKFKQPEAKQLRKVTAREDLQEFIQDLNGTGLRCARSVFVADQAGPYGRQALSISESDFIVPEKLSSNTAVCIPLLKNPMGRFLIGTQPKELPVPLHFGEDAVTELLPSFRLPESVASIEQATQFLAKLLYCKPEDITPFGPSFFLQAQLSPERIYPFLLHAPDRAYVWQRLTKPQGRLGRLYDRPIEKSAAYVALKAQHDLGEWYMGMSPSVVNEITARVTSKSASSSLPQAFNDNALPQLRHE